MADWQDASAPDGEAALADALEALGVALRPPLPGSDLAVDLGGGTEIGLQVIAISNASPQRVQSKVAARPQDFDAEVIPVLVAEAIPSGSRAILNDVGWGWLDRRGHLRLVGRGLRVDAAVPPVGTTRPPAPGSAVAGKAGLAVAFELLVSPDRSLGVREAARATGLHPSSTSRALKRLVDAALVDADGRPLVPELFWVLADAWPRGGVALKRAPRADDDGNGLAMNGNDPDGPGWCVSGTRGALAWGAPLVATDAQPAELYVPGPTAERRALQRFGAAARRSTAAATVTVAPVRTVTERRWRRGGEAWPVAHPVVVALDLAADRARGQEILETWDPPAPFARVW